MRVYILQPNAFFVSLRTPKSREYFFDYNIPPVFFVGNRLIYFAKLCCCWRINFKQCILTRFLMIIRISYDNTHGVSIIYIVFMWYSCIILRIMFLFVCCCFSCPYIISIPRTIQRKTDYDLTICDGRTFFTDSCVSSAACKWKSDALCICIVALACIAMLSFKIYVKYRPYY